MPEFTLQDSKPTTVLSAVVGYLAEGGKIVNLLTGFILGTGASLFIAVGSIINAVVTFITTPFSQGGEALGDLVDNLLSEPAGLIGTVADASGVAISDQFGWLALPTGVGVVLVSLWMINKYREQQETGDTLPGLPFDVPDVGPFQIGTTEEGEDEL